MAFTLIVPDSFLRRAKKFVRSHPDLARQVNNVLLDLEQDPFQPHLRLHPLRGKLAGYYAVSISHSYRITLVDIGSHDDVYR